MINIAVIGSRGFNDYPLFKKIMDVLISKQSEPICFISGGANGADSFAEQYAKANNIKIKVILPDWNKYGKSAGFKRNYQIWDESDIGIAFWDGASKGTSHSFQISRDQKKELYVFNYINHKWVKSF